jgi:hypothetical protein
MPRIYIILINQETSSAAAGCLPFILSPDTAVPEWWMGEGNLALIFHEF